MGALMLLGVGWNFMFVGGTTLLTTAYTPDERVRVQATNDFIVFGTVALHGLHVRSGASHGGVGGTKSDCGATGPGGDVADRLALDGTRAAGGGLKARPGLRPWTRQGGPLALYRPASGLTRSYQPASGLTHRRANPVMAGEGPPSTTARRDKVSRGCRPRPSLGAGSASA